MRLDHIEKDKEFQKLEDKYLKAKEKINVIRITNHWLLEYPDGFINASFKELVEDGILRVLSADYKKAFLSGIENELLKNLEENKND